MPSDARPTISLGRCLFLRNATGLSVAGRAKLNASSCQICRNFGTGVLLRESAKLLLFNSSIESNAAEGILSHDDATISLVGEEIVTSLGRFDAPCPESL